MSDSPEEFRRKTEAMFEVAEATTWRVVHRWIFILSAELLERCPGPNNQLPETHYIATGRLRDRFRFSLDKQPLAGHWGGPEDAGDYDQHGQTAMAQIEEAVLAAGKFRDGFIQTDVAYGFIVHEGTGRMPYERPWAQETAMQSERALHAAQQEVGRG